MMAVRHKYRERYRFLGIIAGMIVLLDQFSKAIIVKTLPLYHSVNVIPGFFDITHILNPGGAFGFLASGSETLRKLFFLVLSSAAVVVILYFYHKTPKTHRWLSAALAMILGGAVGNLIDRFRFGQVVDFLDVYVKDLHWPAFNVADSAISIGMCILIWHIITNRMPES